MRRMATATGLGMADVTTDRALTKSFPMSPIPNGLTSLILNVCACRCMSEAMNWRSKLPAKPAADGDRDHLRIVRIQDTLHLGEIWISEAMLAHARSQDDITSWVIRACSLLMQGNCSDRLLAHSPGHPSRGFLMKSTTELIQIHARMSLLPQSRWPAGQLYGSMGWIWFSMISLPPIKSRWPTFLKVLKSPSTAKPSATPSADSKAARP